MSDVLASYSPEDVTVVISVPAVGISHTVSGYVEGSFLTISRLVMGSEPYAGADNSHARVVRANKSATITLSLAQYSESNDIFSQLLENDSQSRDSTWIFNVLVKDQSGRSLYFSRQSYLGGHPDSSFSDAVDGRDWNIHCTHLDQTLGGNGQLSPPIAQELTDLGGEVEDRWTP